MSTTSVPHQSVRMTDLMSTTRPMARVRPRGAHRCPTPALRTRAARRTRAVVTSVHTTTVGLAMIAGGALAFVTTWWG